MRTRHRTVILGTLTGFAIVLAFAASSATAQDPFLLDFTTTLVRPQDLPAYRAGELTVRFVERADRERATEAIAAVGSRIVWSAQNVAGLHVVTVPPGMTLQQAIQAYDQRLDVAYAEPNYLDYPFFVPNDPLFSKQWHLKMIGCVKAWNKTRGLGGVKVAVVDTGVAFTPTAGHPMAPDLVGQKFVHPYDAVDGDKFPVDDNHHGTHVTGTIAQATHNLLGVAGVAFKTAIMPIRTLGPGGGSHAQMADGYAWAADHGAKIINYSAGGSDSTTKHDGVKYAYNKGVLICAAMGNDGLFNSASAYPGRYPETLGIAACTIEKKQAFYSNWGQGVSLTGPGGDTTADTDGNGDPDGVLQNTFATGAPAGGFDYYYFMGTSMATPHVAGAAALAYAAALKAGGNPSAAGVAKVLKDTAEDLGAAGYDNKFGYGLVKVNKIVKMMTGTPPTLDWAGTSGYTKDGVQPDVGTPSTTFKFRVKYTDANGNPPITRKLVIQKLKCGNKWVGVKTVTLKAKSGTFKGGKIYIAFTKLPNAVYRYKFVMEDIHGPATGVPASWRLGPKIAGTPFLCWVQAPGYITDGVNPNGGPKGTKFKFRVLYMDSAGNTPKKQDLVIRRNGKFFKRLKTLAGGGTLRTGRSYRATVVLKLAGKYTYRFDFADVAGPATGAPTGFKSMGPVS